MESTRVLGKVFARVLQYHPDKPNLWIMAAKWEFEDNKNIPNSRSLLQRGLRVNPSSKQLWLEYFRMELLHVEKIQKRRAVLGLNEIEEQQGKDEEEVTPEFLAGKVPEIVYKKAIECIPDDVDFRKSFIDIYHLFEGTKESCDMVYSSMLEDFPLSEEVWNLVARQHLEEMKNEAKKGSVVVTDIQWCALETEMNKLFQEAVNKVPTGKMWEHCIEAFVDLLGDSAEHQIRRREKIVLELFSQASRNNKLTENLYKTWVNVLLQADKKRQALVVCKKAIGEFNTSTSLWIEYLRLKVLGKSKMENIYAEFSTAVKCVDSKKSLPLWSQWIDWCIEKNPEEVKAVFELSLESHVDVATAMRERYVEWTEATMGIKKVRPLYKRLTQTPPVTLSLYRKCIDLELSQEEPSSKRVRDLYEAAVDRFGATHPELWLDYIRFQLKNSSADPSATGQLYWRATKCLDGEYTEQFVGVYSLIQAGRV
ncbi:U3 small nucleolar RNA-associated protein 6 homolog [Montipora foliosa]|uniref:U3 small nucleolar RNA-associated protein 6 homolog n=1 Tax=Montipora foliosa TaxID=591990 RepID=UPI0035F15C03